jgi:hypothetical protein
MSEKMILSKLFISEQKNKEIVVQMSEVKTDADLIKINR